MDSIQTLQGFDSQVPNSCLSEPVDVGNWFSSYEYRSPDPDSNFGIEDSALEARISQRDGEEEEETRVHDEVAAGEKLVQCSRTCVEDENHNEDLNLTKNPDSFSTCSLLSEPPDIRNWFSSYVYESPESDTSSLSGDGVSEENEDKEEGFNFEVMNADEDRSENVHQKGCVEHNSSSDKNMKIRQKQPYISRGEGSAEVKRNSTIASTSNLEKILQPCLLDKSVQYNLGLTNYEETLKLNQRIPGCNREGHLMSLDTSRSAMRATNMVQKNDTREENSKAEIQHDKLDMSTSVAKGISSRSSTCRSNKENDGFVSARKNGCTRENDENSWKKPEKISLECSENTGTVPLACEKRAVTKRKALTEATNLQQYSGMEITGKWQCPQKSKPNLGPALKQLRLERWVRRV